MPRPGPAAPSELVERLRDSERRLAVIADTSPAAVITADHAGVITGWNRKAEEIFGWPADEAVGQTMADTIVPRRHRRAHERGLARQRETGEAKILGKAVQMMARHREGREFPVELVISAGSESGGRLGYVAFVTDITLRRESERLRAFFVGDSGRPFRRVRRPHAGK